MEPVPCNYGLILPKENYLKEVRALCDQYGILLIFDEVITGFRLAAGGAQERFGVKADLTTLGKVIGGGLPVGAYGGRADIMNTIAPDGPVYQAGTLSGNPLAMAAGIATVKKLLEDDIYEQLEKKAAMMKEMLGKTFTAYEGRLLFTGIGSIFAFCFTDLPAITSVDDIRKGDMDQYAAFHREMLSRGVYLAPSGYEVAFLSARHSEADIIKTATSLSDSLKAVLG